jgi:hypothetical protein
MLPPRIAEFVFHRVYAYEKQARRTLDLASRENKALGPVVKRVQRSVPIHPDVLKDTDVPHLKDYTVKESERLEKVVNKRCS